MAAQVDFKGGSEPAQIVIITAAHKERRLGQVVLRRDVLEQGIVEPLVEGHHGRGVALEDLARKGVNVVEGKFHGVSEGGTCPRRRAAGLTGFAG